MSQLISILLAPYHFFFGENGLFGSAALGHKQEDSTQRLYYGIPSLIFAIFGVLFLIVGELSAGKSLVQRYEDEIVSIDTEQADLTKVFNQELKIARATNSGSDPATSTKLNEVGSQLLEKLDSKKLFLSKLNSLAPDQPQHRYQIALTLFSKSNIILAFSEDQSDVAKGLKTQGLSIMNQIAPLDKPGFIDAHLFLAKHTLTRRIQSARDRVENLRLANIHLDNALIRNQDSVDALRLKALIAQRTGELEDAKGYIEKLFETDLFVYPQLCQINSQLKLNNDNLRVLHNARERLDREIGRMTGSSDRRTKYTTYLVDSLHRLENIDAADKVVEDEMAKFSNIEVVQRWGKRLLAIGQELRYRTGGKINTENMQELVGYLRKGYELDPNNEKILQHVVNLRGYDIPGLTEISKEIYQPGRNAPASVENILGALALSDGDYLETLKRFLTATQKDPSNAEYLNNLSFLYLTRPEPDPQEALKLVDRAIDSARKAGVSSKYLTHFYDTKGRALLAFGRIADEAGEENLASSRYAAATAFLLKALVDRPDDLKIIKGVIECYEADGHAEQVKVWTERTKQLQTAKSE